MVIFRVVGGEWYGLASKKACPKGEKLNMLAGVIGSGLMSFSASVEFTEVKSL